MTKHDHSTWRRGAAVLLLGVAAAGAPAAAAEAKTLCAGQPSACPAGAPQYAGLQAALDAAHLSDGHDKVLVGPGTWLSSNGFNYTDSDVAANSIEILGEGDATVLRADQPSKADGFQVLRLRSVKGSRLARVRVVVPDVSAAGGTTKGVSVIGSADVEEIRVEDSGTIGPAAAGMGISFSGGGHLERSSVRMAPRTDAVGSGGAAGSLTVYDSDLRGRRGVLGSSGGNIIIRRTRIEATTGGAVINDGTMAVESSLVHITGEQGVGLRASSFAPADVTLKASHVTLVADPQPETHGVKAESTGKATAELAIDNSIIHGFVHGASRKADDPQGGALVALNHVNYDAANDTSEGNGDILPTNVGKLPVDFVDPQAGDFRIKPSSQLVDGGRTSSYVTLTAKDLAGRARTVGVKRDLGAHEYQALAPQPVIAGAGPVAPGATLALSGAGSHDDDGGDAITAWQWSFGDGAEASGPDVTHAWAAPGTYTVSLEVADTTGRKATTTATVVVAEPAKGPVTSTELPYVPPQDGPQRDVQAPAITRLRRSGRTVALTLSEPASVVVRVDRSRRGRWARVAGKEVRLAGKAGANRFPKALRRLRPGRYRLVVRATDAAGNATLARKAFRVR